MSNSSPQQTYGQYKLRQIAHSTNPIYGISIPRQIALPFQGVKFNIEIVSSNSQVVLNPGTYIVLKSGIDLVKLKEEIDKYNIEDY